jgi:hypothetical protein
MTHRKVQRSAAKEFLRLISIFKAMALAMCVEGEPRYFFAIMRASAI